MVEAVSSELSQFQILVAARYAAEEARASQAQALVVAIYPAQEAQTSQFDIMVPLSAGMDAEVSQLSLMVVGRGRVSNPSLKVSTFTLDGHDFYVLNLGDGQTLLFDMKSKFWTNWGNLDSPRWRHRAICNWPGAVGLSPGAQIVAGDDTHGTLYFLDPDYPYDDHPVETSDTAFPFTRIVQGQVPHRGRDPIDCFGVSLMGSLGDVFDSSLTGVTLEYSDDSGHNYEGAGTLDIDPGDYAARVEWPSLGQIYAPGRLFKITDAGALARIDSLDLFDDENGDG